VHVTELAVVGERTHGHAAVDALVLVDFGASIALAVVDAHMGLDVFGGVLDAHAEVSRPGNQSEPFSEEGPDDTVAVDRFFVGEPGHLVEAEHDRRVVGDLRIERGVFESQREVLVEVGVGRRPHIRREPHAHAVRELRLDVHVAASDVECVVPVCFMQLGVVLQEGDDTEAHVGVGDGGG
jgi:hypothetical protein